MPLRQRNKSRRRSGLLADAAAEVEGVDEFFDEANDLFGHGDGSVRWVGGIDGGRC